MAWSYEDFSVGNKTKEWEKKQAAAESDLSKLGKFSYEDYQESDAVKAAKAALDQQMANKPGAYQSQWQNGINKTLNEILNRDQFSYDMNADALYQQYKDQYSTQGKMAMMDTIGQAAALTGGLDNSYAQSVGQQTYQGYMQQLNDRVPELYQLALDQYNQRGQDLLNKYGVLSSQEAVDYGKYRDSVSDWTSERNYLSDAYNAERSWDYGLYSDAYNRAFGEYSADYEQRKAALERADSNYWNSYDADYSKYSDDRNLSYTDYRNGIADQQWQKDFNEAQRQYNQNYALQQAQLEEQKRANKASEAISRAKANSSGSGNGKDGDTPKIDYSGWDAGDWEAYFAQIRQEESKASAELHMSELIADGVLPKNMVVYAAIGARGGMKGH